MKKEQKVFSLLQAFNDCVTQSPNKIAYQVIEENDTVTRLSFFDLKQRAQAYANQLKQLGVNQQDRVLLISETHPYAITAIVGCFMANVIPVPVDAHLNGDNWLQLIEKVQAVAISISPTLLNKLPERAKAHYPLLNHHEKENIRYRQSINKVTIKTSEYPKQGACLFLMSSGTSGASKTIALSENNLFEAIKTLSIFWTMSKTSNDVYCPLPIHHVAPLIGAYLANLYYGHTVTMSQSVDAVQIRKGFMLSQPVAALFVPPILQMMWRGLQAKLSNEKSTKKFLADLLSRLNLFCYQKFSINLGRFFFLDLHEKLGHRLQIILTGGAKCDKNIIKNLQAFGLPIVEIYGLSETSGLLAYTNKSIFHRRVKQFPPLEGLSIFQADKQGVGEICYHGKQLMQAYFLEPEKTGAAIVDGVFHTGDIGYLRNDELEIVGRKNDIIVTSGGKNVFPDEVESLYGKLTSLTEELCVFAMPIDAAQEVHAAIVMKQEDIDKNVAQKQILDVAASIANQLPFHLIIKEFHFVTSLPKTNRFKIKRQELPDLVKAPSLSQKESLITPAKTETERKLLAIWKQCFSSVNWQDDVEANFFSLGGDSLILTDISACINHEFCINADALSFEMFLTKPTVRHQAKMIEQYQEAHKEEKTTSQKNKKAPQNGKNVFYVSKTWPRVLGGIYQTLMLFFLPLLWFACAWPVYAIASTLQLILPSSTIWLLAPLGFTLWGVFSFSALILLKWLVIGKFKSGSYPIHSLYYYRWWTITAFSRLLQMVFWVLLCLINDTKIMTIVYRLLGAKIGKNSYVNTLNLVAYDMLQVGKECQIANSASCICAYLERGLLIIKPIVLGDNVSVKHKATILAGSKLEKGTQILPHQVYAKTNELKCEPSITIHPQKPLMYEFLQCLFGLILAPFLIALPIALSIFMIGFLSAPIYLSIWLVFIFSLFSFLCLSCTLKWLLLGKIKEKTYRRYGWYAYRKWLMGRLFYVANFFLAPFIGTSLHRLWLTCCGVKIDKHAIYGCKGLEILGELLVIKANVLVAVDVTMSTDIDLPDVNYEKQAPIIMEKSSYALYDSHLSGGSKIESQAGLGAKTLLKSHEVIPSGQQKNAECLTPITRVPSDYAKPSRRHYHFWLWANNIRFIVIFGLLLGYIGLGTWLFSAINTLPWVIIFTLLFISAKCYYMLLIILFGRKVSVGDKPIWYTSVQRMYMSTFAQHWTISHYILPDIMGTPLYHCYLRLRGGKLGKDVICFGTITDPEMISIDDYTIINDGVVIIGHMMMGNTRGRYIINHIKIGKHCSLGINTLIFPNSDIKNNVIIKSEERPVFSIRYNE